MLKATKISYRTDLRRLIEEETCDFANETVKSLQDLEEEIRGFVIDEQEYKNANIPVSDIVGTNHGSYLEQPWSSLIMGGKKSDRNLKDLAKNPEYYLSDAPKLESNFKKVGSEIYVCGGGNNRAIIAKFFFHYNRDKIAAPLLRNAPLIECTVDWESLNIKKEIDSLLEQPRFEHLTLTLLTEYGGAIQPVHRWHLFNNRLKGDTSSLKLSRNQLSMLLEGLKSDNFLRRIFGLGFSKYLRTSDILCVR